MKLEKAAIAAWIAQQPAGKEWSYIDSTNCLLASYLKAQGAENPRVGGMYYSVDNSHTPIPLDIRRALARTRHPITREDAMLAFAPTRLESILKRDGSAGLGDEWYVVQGDDDIVVLRCYDYDDFAIEGIFGATSYEDVTTFLREQGVNENDERWW